MFHRVTSQLLLMLLLSLASMTMVSAAWACGGGGGSGRFVGHYGYCGSGGHPVVVGGDDYQRHASYGYGYDASCHSSIEQSCGWQYGCGSLPNGAGAYYYPPTAASGCGY